MKSGVIGGSINGIDKLAPVLDGFNPKAVLAKYGDNWQAVLDTDSETTQTARQDSHNAAKHLATLLPNNSFGC